jgi:hypothetical protein
MATDPDLEWTATILDVKPQVILHDRLMTDAALGTVPIKSEHSYSLTSDGDSIPDSPLSLDNKMDGEYDLTELAGNSRRRISGGAVKLTRISHDKTKIPDRKEIQESSIFYFYRVMSATVLRIISFD